MIYFNYFKNYKSKIFGPKFTSIPKNVIIKQPKLRTEFFSKKGKNRLYRLKTRMIWNFFTRKTAFIEAIDDLGDEYMNYI